MPQISVIIPVYNTEEYVLQCLASVEAQTYKDFEVIVVNDGSKDQSAEIVEKYIKEKDLKQWRLINQNNQGPSAARNAGLDCVSGEWVVFIDSDDWVEPHFLQTLVNASTAHPGADLCISGYRAYDEAAGTYEVWSNYSCEYGSMPAGLTTLQNFGFVWARMYKRSVFEEYHVRFDERIRYCEDNAFQLDFSRRISGFCQVNEVTYNYRINRSGSLTTNLIHPRIKYYLCEHLEMFCDALEEKHLVAGVRENTNFSQVMWNCLSTSVINDILDNRFRKANERRKLPFMQEVVKTYRPRTKKDRIFIWLWKKTFLVLIGCIKIYYGNFETFRSSKLLKRISRGE